mgnify:FL=1
MFLFLLGFPVLDFRLRFNHSLNRGFKNFVNIYLNSAQYLIHCRHLILNIQYFRLENFDHFLLGTAYTAHPLQTVHKFTLGCDFDLRLQLKHLVQLGQLLSRVHFNLGDHLLEPLHRL